MSSIAAAETSARSLIGASSWSSWRWPPSSGPSAHAVRSGAAGAAAPAGRTDVAHPFGLDELGRDILARVLAGARISFFVGLTVVGVSAVVGTLLGAVAGYFGGALDDVISRVIDIAAGVSGAAAGDCARRRARAESRQRAVRADHHRVGRLRPAGPRSGAARARVRVRAGGAGARRPHAAHAAGATSSPTRSRRSSCRRRSAWRARSSAKRR